MEKVQKQSYVIPDGPCSFLYLLELSWNLEKVQYIDVGLRIISYTVSCVYLYLPNAQNNGPYTAYTLCVGLLGQYFGILGTFGGPGSLLDQGFAPSLSAYVRMSHPRERRHQPRVARKSSASQRVHVGIWHILGP